jgi:hypothetical protein
MSSSPSTFPLPYEVQCLQYTTFTLKLSITISGKPRYIGANIKSIRYRPRSWGKILSPKYKIWRYILWRSKNIEPFWELVWFFFLRNQSDNAHTDCKPMPNTNSETIFIIFWVWICIALCMHVRSFMSNATFRTLQSKTCHILLKITFISIGEKIQLNL